MRMRTDRKRREIVAAAAELFLELGYEATSMSMVSRRLGGSKATLYGYFGSKDELLLAVVEAESEEIAAHAIPETASGDVAKLLRDAGMRVIQASTASRSRLIRIVASLPAGSKVAAAFRDRLVVPGFTRLCALMRSLVDKGSLRTVDPSILAMHFKALLEGDLFERAILMPHEDIAPRDAERAAADATDIFLRAYAV